MEWIMNEYQYFQYLYFMRIFNGDINRVNAWVTTKIKLMRLVHLNYPMPHIIKIPSSPNHLWHLATFKGIDSSDVHNDVDWNDTWTRWKALMMTCSTSSPLSPVIVYTTFSVLLVATKGWKNRATFVLSEESFFFSYCPPISPGNRSLLHVIVAPNKFPPIQLIIWSLLK